MSLNRDQILKTVRETGGRLTKRGLVRELGLAGDQRRDLRVLLKTLEEEGLIVRTEKRTYRSADTLPNVMVLRIEEIDDQGDLIGVPARWDGKGPAPRLRVVDKKHQSGNDSAKRPQSPKLSEKLGIGNRALCRIEMEVEGDETSYRAEIIKTLGAGPRQQLGVVIKGGRGWRIRPIEKGARYDHIPAKGEMDAHGLKDQDLVMFSLTSARHKGDKIAKIHDVVGSATHARSASLISLYAHNIPLGFNGDEIEQASTQTIPKIDKTRQDLREVPLLTIDPDDAKDFDDAIYACADDSPKNKGGHIVWVAIADVSAYVLPGTALDKGALKRGNSVYLPDRVEPMLPEALSADLCSLRPNEDRACLAVKMRFNEQGDKIGHQFVRGLMRSHARLRYAEAQTVFQPSPDGIADAAKPVVDILRDIYKAYQALDIARSKRGPLDIDMPERRVKVDENGNVASITVRERYDAHKLVEEFMIQANVAAAEALEAKKCDLIYRVHEAPEREKVQGLADFLPSMDLNWSMGERTTTKRFNRLIGQARDKDLAETISMSVLRTQMQAYYGPKNGGHFGLNLTHYAHFTSPIRRYADLVVHRALIKAFNLGAGGQSDEEVTRLKEISDHISDTERRAMAAERDAKDRYIAAFLQDKVGVEFGGRIAGVTRAGLFVQLDDTGADGYCPISLLGAERFDFDEKTKSLVGCETGGTFKFGARVRVRLEEVKPIQGGLVFDVLSEPAKGKPLKRTGHSGYGGNDPYGRRKSGRRGSSQGNKNKGSFKGKGGYKGAKRGTGTPTKRG